MTPFSLFLCTRCLGLHNEIESQLPEDELWELFRIAHKQYQLHIHQGDKTYNRFVNDLISYHLYIGSSDEHIIRTHIRNISSLHELLNNRMDLVEDYFSKETFTKEDYIRMSLEFNSHTSSSRQTAVIARFSQKQLSIIADVVNQKQFFTIEVDSRILEGFFLCSLDKPLIAHNTVPVLLMLNAFYHAGFLSNDWQKLLADNCLLAPESTKKACSQTAISTRLHNSLRNKIQGWEFKNLVKELQETT